MYKSVSLSATPGRPDLFQTLAHFLGKHAFRVELYLTHLHTSAPPPIVTATMCQWKERRRKKSEY